MLLFLLLLLFLFASVAFTWASVALCFLPRCRLRRPRWPCVLPRWRLRGPRWPCVLARCCLRGPRWPCVLSRCVRVFAPWPIGHMFSLGDYIRLLWLLVSFGFPRISLRCFSLSLVLSFVFFLSYPSLYVSFLFTDVFTSPMWAELNHVEDPSLRRLAEKLPEVVLGSRADNTTLSYLNGFKRCRSWACKFPEITVLPATPAYVS